MGSGSGLGKNQDSEWEKPKQLSTRLISRDFPRTDPKVDRVRVAILSFLFNWPSTGGGIIHTVELATFLRQAGFEVALFYARYAPWGIGQVEECPFPGRRLEFQEHEWTLPRIQARFREAVVEYSPEFVLITDSWNIKPYLAEAVRGYRFLLGCRRWNACAR
jgi:hypothetical protein